MPNLPDLRAGAPAIFWDSFGEQPPDWQRDWKRAAPTIGGMRQTEHVYTKDEPDKGILSFSIVGSRFSLCNAIHVFPPRDKVDFKIVFPPYVNGWQQVQLIEHAEFLSESSICSHDQVEYTKFEYSYYLSLSKLYEGESEEMKDPAAAEIKFFRAGNAKRLYDLLSEHITNA